MKTRNYLFAIVLFVLAINPLLAQNLNDIQRGQRGYIPPPIDREQGGIAVENTLENIDQEMDIYAKEFELDAFEKAVLKNYIVEFETEKMALLSDETLSYDVKQQSLLKLNEKLRGKLNTVLTQDQIGAFELLHFAPKSEKKKKRKKKN